MTKTNAIMAAMTKSKRTTPKTSQSRAKTRQIAKRAAIMRWLIVLAIPFFLGMLTIRLLIAWDYPAFEYPRIEPDRYGFTPAQRLDLAHATLDYMQRADPADEIIYLLQNLRLPNSDTPLYNAAEISHMIDVKNVADSVLTIAWLTGIVAIGGVLFLLARPETRREGYKAMFYGGLLTSGILLLIALFILLAWSIFFVQFHNLLFPPGTWTFNYTDGLIRLFPEQFWFDAGVILSVGTLVQGLIVTAVGYALYKKA